MPIVPVVPEIQSFLNTISTRFHAGSLYLGEEFTLPYKGSESITLKSNYHIRFLRVPGTLRRAGDAGGQHPLVWWRFYIEHPANKCWPIRFELSPDGQTLKINQTGKMGRARGRSDLNGVF